VSTEEQVSGDQKEEKSPESGPEPAEPREENQADADAQAGAEAAGDEDLAAEVARLKEEVLRAHADMQNLRRRVDRDVENAHKYALEKFVKDLVAVVDNLERATASIDPENEHTKAVGEGVELTLKSLLDVLRRFNVEQVNPEGEAFDPDRHQAMTMVPNPELAPNTVMDVFQKGYLLNGRLVRPAMVVVSKGADA
jgi:molecular chaperone GrpE